MSFFDTISDLASGVVDFLGGNSVGSNLARTALTGYALSQLNSSINKQNDAASDARAQPTAKTVSPGETLQVVPDQNNRIPVLYGHCFAPGIIVDAQLSQDRTLMTYVFAISEKTGTQISNNQPTTYQFNNVYVNDQRVVFKPDGVTLDYTIDRNGIQDISQQDFITIRFYAGSSFASSQQPQNDAYSVTLTPAWDIVPTWTPMHAMYGLIFCVITVRYNSEKNLRGVPNMLFEITSSMTQPGDVLYDYATNTRYGAGIAPEDIYIE
jgi:hypothetical protein